MNFKKVVISLILLLAAFFGTSAYAEYTESFTITESGSTKADNLNEKAISIRNNRNVSDKKTRGANLREAYIKFDLGGYTGQYPVRQARLRLYLKTKPSNTGVLSDTETPTCDVYAFGSVNTDWSGTSITYTKALANGVRPAVDELSAEVAAYSDDKVCGMLDMHSFDAKSDTTQAYYFDITPFVNDLLASGQTRGTICLMQAGGSISRESTVMQFYCEDTAPDAAMIPAVEITPDIKTAVRTVKDFTAAKKPSVLLAGYNNTDEARTVTLLGVITDVSGRVHMTAAAAAELATGGKAQAIRMNFADALPEDITDYALYVYALGDAETMQLAEHSYKYGEDSFAYSSASGTPASGYPEISGADISARDIEKGTITLTGAISAPRAGVEIAARAYIAGGELTSAAQAFETAHTDEDGGFTLVLAMPETSGSYEIVLGGLNVTAGKRLEGISYFKPSDVADALAQVNAAQTAEKLGALLRGENAAGQRYAQLLRIEYPPVLRVLEGDEDITDFCEYVLKKRNDGFATVDALAGVLAEAADLNMIAAADKIDGDITAVIERYVSETDIFEKLYNNSEIALDDVVKNKALSVLVGRRFADTDELCDAFCEAVVVKAVTGVLYGKVEQIMSIGKAVLGFDIGEHSDYNKLSESQKAAVMKKFAGEELADAEAVSELLERAIKEVKSAVSEKPSGGGGGGSSSVVIKVTEEEIKAPAPEPIDEVNYSGFTDMQGFDWALESVNSLVRGGVIAEGEQFRPGENITRAEFVKMLVCAAGLEDSTAECAFEDTSENMWHYRYIAAAYKNGVAGGVSDTLFGVGRDITRQEAAALAYRVMKLKNARISLESSSFADEDSIADWALTAVYALKNAGVISGISESEFAPQKNATRAEAAVIIGRLTDYIDNEGETTAE